MSYHFRLFLLLSALIHIIAVNISIAPQSIPEPLLTRVGVNLVQLPAKSESPYTVTSKEASNPTPPRPEIPANDMLKQRINKPASPKQETTHNASIENLPKPKPDAPQRPEPVAQSVEPPLPASNSISDHAKPEIVPPNYVLGSDQNPQPAYPSIAGQQGLEGDVIIGVHVDPQGQVKFLEILKSSNYGPLDFSAWKTVKDQWQFEPATEDGMPVSGFIEVPISFRKP